MFGVKAAYRREHCDVPAVLTSPEDIDALVDILLASGPGANLAQLFSLARCPLPSGYPDHELLVGADCSLQVGVLAFMDASGNWVPDGSSSGRVEVAYSEMGHRREFPEYCEIAIDLVREAAKEFMTTGGQRPTCVRWKEEFPDLD